MVNAESERVKIIVYIPVLVWVNPQVWLHHKEAAMTVGTDWGREVSVHPTTTPVFDKTYHENINGVRGWWEIFNFLFKLSMFLYYEA